MTTLAEKRILALAKAQAFVRTRKPETAPNKDAENGEKTEPYAEDNNPIKPSSFGLRPHFSTVNINCDKWYQTMDEKARLALQDPPSLADGMDRETEKNLRFFGCSLIQEGAVLLKLPQVAAATGQILFQRFYYLKSFLKFRYEHTVMACLLLASKIEEEPRRTRDVYNVFYRLEQLHKLRESGRAVTDDTAARLKPPPLDISYVNTKNNIIKAERRLLATLGFVVHVKHPHKLICAYCFVLRAHHRTDLIQRAWTYMNDGLRTDMFVRYSPETIACACIFLAARTVQPQVPLPDKPRNWYELFDASDTDVHTIAMMLLNMYANQKAVSWREMDEIIEKLRAKIETSQKAAKAQLVAQKITSEKKKVDEDSDRDDARKRRGKSRSRSRSKSRSRSPKRNKYSPVRRRRESPDRNGRAKGRGGKGGREDRRDRERRDDRRDDKRKRSRSRSKSRERYSDRDRERAKLKMPEHNEPLEEGVDQLSQWRERCGDHVADFKAILEECNDRVNGRSQTEETCHQEMTDYIHHLDECAFPKAFAALK
ncbi:Cyclin protein [Necator americanus]|uniref:Cyclin protein n=1 Tax=Necator americanus TaxID=51031 RepID=W2TMV5_NECAM|nr:Cyclin protein [Necator americanus]ETN82322.1 Cyclin protein [Necator americanus]